MTLKRLAYALAAILSIVWLAGFIPVLYSVWSLTEFCASDGSCVPVDTITSKLQLANVAALTLTASLTPVVITLMLIPFTIWFYKQLKNRNTRK